MKFDIPINFTIEAMSEEQALKEIMWFIKTSIFTLGKEDEVVDYELFEFIPADSTEVDGESCSSGCGNHNCC